MALKNFCKNIIGINKFKRNKLYFCCKVIASLIFAITILLDSLLVFSGSIFGNIAENHFEILTIKNIVIFLSTFCISYIFISVIEIIVDKFEPTIYNKKNRKTKNVKAYFGILAVLLICWLPYILSYFPGGIFSDTIASIKQATGEVGWNNFNPILYGLILKLFINTGLEMQLGIELFTVFQVLVMAAVISCLIYWLYKRNISMKYIVLTTAYFAIFSLIPVYAISIWKDTPFCIALFAFTICIAETVYKNGQNLEKITGTLLFTIISLLVVFLRSNGLYIALAVTIVLAVVYRKRIFNKLKLFFIIQIAEFILVFIIQGPIYNNLGLNNNFIENLGVPVQQICYVIAKDGNITEEQKEFINNIYPIENIKRDYSPCIVDKIKWGEGFNAEFIRVNKKDFFKTWLEIFIHNPTSYVKAYLLNTIGFWDVNKATQDGYMCVQMWEHKDEVIGVRQTDYIQSATGKSVRNIITPTHYMSAAVFLFITIFGALITMYKKRWSNLLICLIPILAWGTIMIAAPLAFSLRYVFILVLVIPLMLLAPFLKREVESENEIPNKRKENKQ